MDSSIFTQVADAVESLQKVINEAPEVIECLKLMQGCKSETVLIPVRADKLIGQKEASKILGVSANRIGEYVKDGLLTAYYTPPASSRKFWLSEVMNLPQRSSAV